MSNGRDIEMDQQQGGGFPPTQMVSVTLEAQQWNVIIGQLMEGQYKTMAPLIGRILSFFSSPQPQGQTPSMTIGEGPPPGYVAQALGSNANGVDNGTINEPGEAGAEVESVRVAG
jgi:hypothetical protein